MKRAIVIVMYASLLCVLCSAAFAQYESDATSRIGLRFSFFSPSDSILSDIKNIWSGPVLDYNLSFDQFDRPSSLISVGMFGEDESFTKAKMYPLIYSHLKRYGNNENGSAWYVGGNAGVYFTSFRTIAGFSTIEESGIEYGLGLVAGREFSDIWYAELSYNYVTSMDVAGVDVGFSGLMLSVGTRLAY